VSRPSTHGVLRDRSSDLWPVAELAELHRTAIEEGLDGLRSAAEAGASPVAVSVAAFEWIFSRPAALSHRGREQLERAARRSDTGTPGRAALRLIDTMQRDAEASDAVAPGSLAVFVGGLLPARYSFASVPREVRS
jgi:hypothetical protein